ncbi:30S ribosomal protein S13 [Candidatus Saccharibacteria bacterium]|nr:30S ribosomal protein S13 [Candidatus Saccharibacteria bacterium]
MARIAGVNIPDAKRVEVALTYIYGIGPAISRRILEATKVSPDTRVKDLTEGDVVKLREFIDKNIEVEGDLQRQVSLNINRLKEINSYRGLRHKANLPVHGQRTKTNARTKRGRKITMGSGRKKSAAKT